MPTQSEKENKKLLLYAATNDLRYEGHSLRTELFKPFAASADWDWGGRLTSRLSYNLFHDPAYYNLLVNHTRRTGTGLL
jgi:hypothetical protein